jgi:hypothetical protein
VNGGRVSGMINLQGYSCSCLTDTAVRGDIPKRMPGNFAAFL